MNPAIAEGAPRLAHTTVTFEARAKLYEFARFVHDSPEKSLR